MFWKIIRLGSQLGMHSHYSQDIRPSLMPIAENVSYVDDGLAAHKMDILYPMKSSARHPVILNIHGGAFCMHSKDRLYRNYAMRLAGAEFAVVNINYRLAPRSTYPAQIEDVLSAIAYVSRNAEALRLNPHNFFLAGDSAGAYLAAMAACILTNESLRAHYAFSADVTLRAVAANSGMYDFTTLMDEDVSFPMKRKMIELLFGQRNFERAACYPYSSVTQHVTAEFPPVYLMDTEVRSFVKEQRRLQERLQALGVEHMARVFAREENLMHAFHIMGKYPQSDAVLLEMLEFFRKHLQERHTQF